MVTLDNGKLIIRGIRSLKDCLKRDKPKKVPQQVLDELTAVHGLEGA